MKIFYLHLCYNMAPNPTYTGAPANRETFVFAQLCLETTGIDLEKATIINLYDNSDNIQPLAISFDQFMAYFYPDGRSFSINCDASGTRVSNVPMTQTFGGGDFMRLDAWVRASRLEGDAGAGGVAGTDASGVQFELTPEVLKRWSDDLGVSQNCWTPCSLMNITSELLSANYICNFACDVCCSVSTFELAQALNSQANQGSLNPGAQYDGRDASRPVKKGDCLALSLLFTNPNVGVRPIDVRLNFCISSNYISSNYGVVVAAVCTTAAAAPAAGVAGAAAADEAVGATSGRVYWWLMSDAASSCAAWDLGAAADVIAVHGANPTHATLEDGAVLTGPDPGDSQRGWVDLTATKANLRMDGITIPYKNYNGSAISIPEFTFMAWVKPSATSPSTEQHILMLGSYVDADYISMTLTLGTPNLITVKYKSNNSGEVTHTTSISITRGSATHIAFLIQSNGPYYLYVNGASVVYDPTTRSPPPVDLLFAKAALGRPLGDGAPFNNSFEGSLRDVRIYNKALLSSPIYNAANS